MRTMDSASPHSPSSYARKTGSDWSDSVRDLSDERHKARSYSSYLFFLALLRFFPLLLFIRGRMRSCFFFFPFFLLSSSSSSTSSSSFSRYTQTSRWRRIFSFPLLILKVPASYVSYIDDSYIETMDIPKEILHARFEAPVPLNLSFRVHVTQNWSRSFSIFGGIPEPALLGIAIAIVSQWKSREFYAFVITCNETCPSDPVKIMKSFYDHVNSI